MVILKLKIKLSPLLKMDCMSLTQIVCQPHMVGTRSLSPDIRTWVLNGRTPAKDENAMRCRCPICTSNFPFGLGLWGAPFWPIFGAPFWAKKSPLFNPQSSTKPTGKLPICTVWCQVKTSKTCRHDSTKIWNRRQKSYSFCKTTQVWTKGTQNQTLAMSKDIYSDSA